jgi:hypothetical protein
LVYLGGNGIYENASTCSAGRRWTSVSGSKAGRAPALFRALDPPVPERAPLGVATERCGVLGTPYRINAANHPVRQRAPKAGGGRRQVVNATCSARPVSTSATATAWPAREVDTSSGIGAVGIPPDCATEDLAVPPVALPNGLSCWPLRIPMPVASAQMVYYEHPGGGIVFSAGSLTFGGSLVVDKTIQELIGNVLARAGV